ncbi:hypothetical protein HO133_002431 [Letharia lupina]|uniref:BTB domain-containing protein n=1 Tax=Letharia lupina TaxID=560253 RepID=A0A8H6CDS9_9LECA|nr:uncharacterized protein HO133_002431 [Letharia lupina]KAF6221575.1 hypothetical protein HO133_002431 [Letharia lupina]
MESHNDFQDSWEHDTHHEYIFPVSETRRSNTGDPEQEGLGVRSRSLYEEYGTNEPYAKPDDVESCDGRDPDSFFKLLTGPSTNFYVGLDEKHYTIPKRLLYHFSDYARICLEGSFWEARANAAWLPDVDSDVFQWLWQWLYTGKLKVYSFYNFTWDWSEDEQLQQACQVLCRLHVLGERLLFDERFLQDEVQRKLVKVIERAKTSRSTTPLTPQIVEEILSDSAPVQYGSIWNWQSTSLRPFVVEQLCTLDFCTTTDFVDWVGCFELDGAFAAEIMAFMADELKWAVKRWEAQVGSPVDVLEKKKQFAEDRGNSKCLETRPKNHQGIWLALRIICTFAGCTTTDLRAYSQCFELDGAFAVEILAYMAEELRWIVERWGEERGSRVDVAVEKEEEERIAQEESDLQRMVDRIMRRVGWS